MSDFQLSDRPLLPQAITHPIVRQRSWQASALSAYGKSGDRNLPPQPHLTTSPIIASGASQRESQPTRLMANAITWRMDLEADGQNIA